MNMFNEIDKLSKELPGFKTVTNEVTSHELNNYQIIALVVFFIALCVGIIFGNIFPSCGSTSGLYASRCTATEFNFSLTVAIWFIGFLVCVFFYGIGHIISLLDLINKNLTKKK